MPIIFVINNNIKQIYDSNVTAEIIIVIKIDIKTERIKGKFADVYINIINKYT
jgi:hypothetical protein